MQKDQPFTFILVAGCIPLCLAFLLCWTQTQEHLLFQTFNHQWLVQLYLVYSSTLDHSTNFDILHFRLRCWFSFAGRCWWISLRDPSRHPARNPSAYEHSGSISSSPQTPTPNCGTHRRAHEPPNLSRHCDWCSLLVSWAGERSGMRRQPDEQRHSKTNWTHPTCYWSPACASKCQERA